MREVFQAIGQDGAFLIYEPARNDGEGRPAFMDRFEEIGRRDWTTLSDEEFKEAINHVRTCDLPETLSDWEELGREAGFSGVTDLYMSSDGLFRLINYRR